MFQPVRLHPIKRTYLGSPTNIHIDRLHYLLSFQSLVESLVLRVYLFEPSLVVDSSVASVELSRLYVRYQRVLEG
jgi:hypothetical protein